MSEKTPSTDQCPSLDDLPEFGELPSDEMLRIIGEHIPQNVDMSQWESL